MAVEWTIMIEGKNEFDDVCRKAVRIDKSWERLFDSDLGLSIEDGCSAERSREPRGGDLFLFRRVCLDCHRFRPVKDYMARKVRTVSAPLRCAIFAGCCRDCHPGIVGGLAPLMKICPDRAPPELMELTARLVSAMPYRQAAKVLAEFLPIEPTETHAPCASVPSGSAQGIVISIDTACSQCRA